VQLSPTGLPTIPGSHDATGTEGKGGSHRVSNANNTLSVTFRPPATSPPVVRATGSGEPEMLYDPRCSID
jgi:hypothetical protein